MNADHSPPAIAQWTVIALLIGFLVMLYFNNQSATERVTLLEARLLQVDGETSRRSEALGERVARLEGQLGGSGDAVAATGFLLKDHEGRTLASLTADDGMPALKLFSKHDEASATIDVTSDGAGRISVHDAVHRSQVRIGPRTTGDSVAIAAQDVAGKDRIVIAADKKEAFVTVLGDDANELVRITAAERGAISTFDRAGNQVTLIESDQAGNGRVTTFAPGSKGKAEIGIDGGGFLATRGASGDRAVTLSSTADGGAVTTYGPSDQATVTLGSSATGSGKIETRTAAGQPLVALEAAGDKGTITTFAKGAQCVAISATEGNQGMIQTFDAAGHNLVQLGADDGGGRVSAYQAGGEGRASLRATERGGVVTTNGVGGAALAEIGAADEGQGSVTVFNRGGHECVAIGAIPDGAGFVSTFAADRHRLVHLGCVRSDHGAISTFGPNGDKQFNVSPAGVQILAPDKTIATLGRDTAGNGIFQVTGIHDQSEVRIFTGPNGGGLMTFEADGAASAQLPQPQPSTEPSQP